MEGKRLESYLGVILALIGITLLVYPTVVTVSGSSEGHERTRGVWSRSGQRRYLSGEDYDRLLCRVSGTTQGSTPEGIEGVSPVSVPIIYPYEPQRIPRRP